METPNSSNDNSVVVEVVQPTVETNRESAEELFKKFTEAGSGLLNLARERFEKIVNSFMEKGNISREDGKEMFHNFMDEADKARDNFETRIKDVSDKIWGRLDIANRREMSELKERIARLEALLAEKEQQG